MRRPSNPSQLQQGGVLIVGVGNSGRISESKSRGHTRHGFPERNRAKSPGRSKLRNNTLIPKGRPWYLQQALSINGDGQIMGYSTIGGNIHAFLATPCDEDRD
jgi:hypothetical protein